MKNKEVKKNKNRKIPFIITISYLLSFLVIRLLVTIAGSAQSEFAKTVHQGPPGVSFHIGRNIILFGYHIHHFYFGIILIAFAGWLSLVKYQKIKIERVAVLYGIGLGLLMDEIGLLLTWGDYYSSLSYLLSLFLLGVFLNVLYFPSFWKEFKEEHTKKKESFFFKKLDLVIKLTDFLSLKLEKTEKIRVYFVGVAYLLVGIFILVYPRFVYYWIAGLFFLQGISLLVKGSA
ncbi:MAG: hypothetical protein FXF47_08875 [Candidatus Mcinerneyibacterium aminivorans]|uniref:Uncharacterized protein n=1 Tax=Candidatus Mcinerneyibacterium aminivorans TaxID=2703815 RepID=A0A5D0MGD3_9BACT|nr:MAG: hypothetical protein FXF47_08875 [Candidatus Mcinerneyibacterium aminivorans]